ncbi:MAG: hypothetical protein ACI4QD_03290, partial [Kiritimatiellia bacterium]
VSQVGWVGVAPQGKGSWTLCTPGRETAALLLRRTASRLARFEQKASPASAPNPALQVGGVGVAPQGKGSLTLCTPGRGLVARGSVVARFPARSL